MLRCSISMTSAALAVIVVLGRQPWKGVFGPYVSQT
jgi:hypothetical protein